MSKKLIGLGLGVVLILGIGTALAASPFFGLGPAQRSGYGPKWEYLVIATRAEFAIAVSDVTMQPVVEEDIGLPFAYEARMLESRLNHLGEAGWELVAVIGTIDGDQEFVFKRPKR
ncbi:MAG: hypothetical protein IMX02_00035 [Limnochordaceae bacterium]|nr:hypothetical protein [Limnochordaceae bacterium]